jgi:Phage integrase, N-terminal SAM-like domain
MTTAAPSTALATIQPAFTDAERLALAGFLAGYRGLTREAYTLDLRQFTTWCRARSLNLFAVRRAEIGSFARELEALGRARATVTRRLCTIAGFYKYAVEEDLLEHSPAAHVRRPRVDYESHAVALRPQRARRPAGRRRARAAGRACADLPARAERAAGLRSHRRRHRAPGTGARAPDADHHPQERQGRHHPARATHRPGNRPGHRRAHQRVSVPGRGRAPARPARRRADRPQGRPPRRDHQDRHAPHSQARVHHRRPGCRGAAARRARSRLSRRSADHDAICQGEPAAAWTATPPTSSPLT